MADNTVNPPSPCMLTPSSDPPLPASTTSVDPPGGELVSWSARWHDVFLGRGATQRTAVRRLAYTWLTYGFVDVILLVSAMLGLMPSWAALAQVACHWAGMAVFYVLLRGGHTLQRRDPSLAFEQLLFGVSAIVLSYALSPMARGAALQLLCLALVFDMQRLSSRQLATAAWGAVVLLLVTLLLSWLLRHDDFNLRREVLNLLMAGVQLPVLSLIARDVRGMRARQLRQRVDLQETLERLETLSQRDALTGLFNRHHMSVLLDQEIKRFQRQGRPFSLALIDIDFFKQVNDRFGHAVGDAALQTFSQLARQHLPAADAVARWGGEEFLILIPEHNVYEAMASVERLRQRIEAHDWQALAPTLALRFSAGVTEHTRLSDSIDHTLERADQALYQAKAHGRNQVRCQTRSAA